MGHQVEHEADALRSVYPLTTTVSSSYCYEMAEESGQSSEQQYVFPVKPCPFQYAEYAIYTSFSLKGMYL